MLNGKRKRTEIQYSPVSYIFKLNQNNEKRR